MNTKNKLALLSLLLAGIMPSLNAALSQGEEEIALVKLRPEVRIAINNGLRHLAAQQRENGAFSIEEGTPTASTAIALMAFMLQGHVPGRDKYGEVMEKGISYLIAKGEAQEGYLGTGSNHAGMYEHGLAVLALSEAWGQSKNKKLGETLRNAVDVTLRAQNDEGGWRYTPQPKDADISMTAMHLVALNSAKEAGIAVPQASIDRAAEYVLTCQNEEAGGFAYTAPTVGGKAGEAGFARSGAGTLALMLAGKREHHGTRRGMAYMKAHPETKFSMKETQHFYYAHYYAIQCMYQSGEDDFRDWYPKVLKSLLAEQKDDGSWHGHGGTAYGTGMAILITGVPYRYLPIYQR